MTLTPGSMYRIKVKAKQTGEISKKDKENNHSRDFVFDSFSRNQRLAHFVHAKCGYRESFSAHALVCGILSIKEISPQGGNP